MDPAHNLDGAREKADDAAEVNVDSDVFELVNQRAADDEFAPGMLVSDNIRLGAMLGAGGMGNVWIAEHLGLDTPVAVKFMSKDLAEDPGCVARFGAEAKLAARIKSPHVVSILDFATTVAKIPYIVMELLDGEDLEVRLRGGKKVGLEDSSRILVQICKALASAHELGVVHRDIKPDNVFLAKHDGE